MNDSIPVFSDKEVAAGQQELEKLAQLAKFSDPQDLEEVKLSAEPFVSNPGFVVDEVQPTPEEVDNGGL